MNTKNRLKSLPAAAGIALVAAVAAPADAATVSGYDYQSAAGVCQGALPAFAGTLRARPLALGNEGAASAFVTCAQQTDDRTFSPTARTTKASIRVGNTGTSGSVTINCTFVHGFGGGAAPTYITRSATVGAGGSAFLIVEPEDVGSTQIRYAQWSCSLPPNAVVYYTGRFYDLEVGA